MIRSNLFSLPRRLAVSLSMALSIALVVCVLAGFLAMAKGFETALKGAGSTAVAVILGGGTIQETGSDLPAATIRTIEATRADIGIVRNPDGTLLASRELVVPVNYMGQGAEAQTIALRGMDETGPTIRDDVSLSKGRLFAPGTREIVLGARLAADLGLEVGETVRLGPVDWTVVGSFTANGSAFESEVWGNLDAVRSAFDRQGETQSLRVQLTAPQALSALNDHLKTVPGTPLIAVSEAALYVGQAGRTAGLIRLFGWPLALLMALGATAGALNTMMTSVADRTVEIATVRALGFTRLSAFIGTWIEAIVLAIVGVLAGLAASWLAFNGWQASTLGANNARMAFQLSVTGEVMMTAGLLGLAIGIIGGALPAFAATRIPLVAALRSKR